MSVSVALLCPSYSRGLQDYTYNLAVGLDSTDIEFTVYTNVEFAHFDSTPNVKQIFAGNPASDVRSLVSHLLSQRPDIVHSQSTNLKLLSLLITVRPFFGYKLVLTPHSSDSTWDRPVYDRIQPYLYRLFDGIIWHTKTDLEEFEEAKMPPQTVIEHGNYSFYAETASPSQSEARQTLDLPQDDVIFLFFGYIRPSKRLDLLLKAFGNLPQDLRDSASIVVAGKPVTAEGNADQAPFQKYEKIIQEHGIEESVFTWPEFIDDDMVPVYFTASDVVVTPYDRISESGVAHIAFAFGRPLIAARVGGFEENLTDGQNGYLFDPDSVRLLRKQLRKAIGNPEEIDEIGERNQKTVSKRSWESVGKITTEFYRQVTNK